MKKVVINKCYGGFGVSGEAILKLREWGLQDALDVVMPGEYYPAWIVDGVEKSPPRLNTGDGLDKMMGMQYHMSHVDRSDWRLIKCVEEMGSAANGRFSDLKIVEIPDHVDYEVEEYDGMEWIAEKHETWG